MSVLSSGSHSIPQRIFAIRERDLQSLSVTGKSPATDGQNTGIEAIKLCRSLSRRFIVPSVDRDAVDTLYC